jgi:hypothetical protein
MGYPTESPGVPVVRLRNQRTQALIRRDVIWQIIAPLAVAVLAALVVAVLVILPVGAGSRSVWADVSLIFLIIPAAATGLVLLALTAALVYGLKRLLSALPFYAKPAQDWVALATYRVNRAATKVAGALMSIRSFWAGARRAAKDVREVVPAGRRH